MLKIYIQEKASSDLKNILRRSIEHWGLKRAELYYDDLTTGIQTLSSNPNLGFTRDDIKKGYRQLSIEKHHIFYRISSSKIHVIRILHEKMLKPNHI